MIKNSEIQLLKKLHKKGLVSYKIFFYNDVSEKVNSLIKSGYKKTAAVNKLARDLRVSNQTVWNALRAFKGI